MVLYKRKQVKIIPPGELPEDLSTQVWFIPETKEWFLQYNDYIRPLRSEEDEIKEVEKNFPEALREHILRFLQFNRISRLDLLVDKVYQVFKNDYFPGENIYLRGIDNKEPSVKQRGTIREKVQYGQDQPTKYLVVRANDNQQAIVTGHNISRDRNHFTKWLIKTFIKMTMSRSYKVGAPWVVKSKYAKKYNIPITYPEDLKQFAETTPTGDIVFIQPKKKRGPQPKATPSTSEEGKPKKVSVKKERHLTPLAPAPPHNMTTFNNSFPAHNIQFQTTVFPSTPTGVATSSSSIAAGAASASASTPGPSTPTVPFKKKFPTHHIPESITKEYEEEESKGTPSLGLSQFQPTKKNIVEDLSLRFDLQNSKPLPKILTLPPNAETWNQQMIENQDDDEEIKRLSKYGLSAISEALQSWIFINVYHTVLNIDTFTFDDFVYAMGWNYHQFQEDGRCELLDEIWCAMLGAIVSNNKNNTKNVKNDRDIEGLAVEIPIDPKDQEDEDEDDDEEEEEEEDHEKEKNGTDEDDRGSESEKEEKPLEIDGSSSEPEENGKDTEPSKAKIEEVEDEEEVEEEEEEEPATHNAYECMNSRGTSWDERLRKRNFKDGNWQCILLGVLSLVEHVPHYKPIIEKIYHILAPKDKATTALAVRNQFYEHLDINLKFQALNILVDLISSSNLVRNHIDDCLESSTVLRRNRLDNLKEQKSFLEIAQKSQSYINATLPSLLEGVPDVPVDTFKRPLDYTNLEMTEYETKCAEKDEEFKKNCESRKEALTKLSELKEAKREIEQKLSELDCQRVKLLGKDRFYNRYWWFENNGLPNLHSGSNGDDDDDDENEAEKKEEDAEDQNENNDDNEDGVRDETYLMGRLWVQGPSNNDSIVHFKSDLEKNQKFSVLVDEIRQAHDDPELFEIEKIGDENVKVKSLSFKKIPQELKSLLASEFSVSVKDTEIYTIKEDQDEKVKDEDEEMKDEDERVKDDEIKDEEMKDEQVKDEQVKDEQVKDEQVKDEQVKDEQVKEEQDKEEQDKEEQDKEVKDEKEDKVIDNEGLLVVPLDKITNLQRKCIEELPDPILTGQTWRYYDNPDDITKLLSWLNPWGKRESILRKELTIVKEAIVSSMEARKKALWIDSTPPEELELTDDIQKLQDKLEADKVKKESNSPEGDNPEEDQDETVGAGAKRTRRSVGARKRQKVATVADALEFGEPDDIDRMISELQETLTEKKEEREINRVVEWVNSRALELFEKSLYDGGDKPKVKSKSKKK
ncbi:ITC1 Imitation switch two complex protein 1 [Candida maltosa Xu316]